MPLSPGRSRRVRLLAPMLAPLVAPLLVGAVGIGLVWAASGCSSYRLVRYERSLGPVRRVAVAPIRNHSYEPGIDAMMTDALVREFAKRGGAALVRDPAAADLVIRGIVPPLVTRSRSFSSVELALEYEVEMGLRLDARLADGTQIPIEDTLLREFELYLASPDVEIERKNRDEALRHLTGLLAARAYDLLAERLAEP